MGLTKNEGKQAILKFVTEMESSYSSQIDKLKAKTVKLNQQLKAAQAESSSIFQTRS